MAASTEFGQAVQCVIDSDINLVSVETAYPGRYSVISENYNGARLAMEHLYSLGHRKIAYISGPMYTMSAPERYRGYLDFLSEKGLEYDPSLVVESAEYSTPDGQEATLELLKKAKGKFTAIFADYDETAFAAMNTLRSDGIRVPEDISVIGFDDLSFSEIAGLSTIRQDRGAIGCIAADILISQMRGLPIAHDYDTRVPTSLIARNSCRSIIH
jgi:LacI family transcriptional regulator